MNFIPMGGIFGQAVGAFAGVVGVASVRAVFGAIASAAPGERVCHILVMIVFLTLAFLINSGILPVSVTSFIVSLQDENSRCSSNEKWDSEVVTVVCNGTQIYYRIVFAFVAWELMHAIFSFFGVPMKSRTWALRILVVVVMTIMGLVLLPGSLFSIFNLPIVIITLVVGGVYACIVAVSIVNFLLPDLLDSNTRSKCVSAMLFVTWIVLVIFAVWLFVAGVSASSASTTHRTTNLMVFTFSATALVFAALCSLHPRVLWHGRAGSLQAACLSVTVISILIVGSNNTTSKIFPFETARMICAISVLLVICVLGICMLAFLTDNISDTEFYIGNALLTAFVALVIRRFVFFETDGNVLFFPEHFPPIWMWWLHVLVVGIAILSYYFVIIKDFLIEED